MAGNKCGECIFLNRESTGGFFVTTYRCNATGNTVRWETPACRFYEPRNTACYLTSACVRYRGLPDDCRELTTLRAFRDGYMKQLPDGEALIAEYYKKAPAIVAAIDASSERDRIYDEIYEIVERCVAMISAGENEKTLSLYCDMVRRYADLAEGENT